MFILNRYDQVIDAQAAKRMFDRWKFDRKQLVWVAKQEYDESNHVLVGDILHPENNDWVVKQMLVFLQQPPLSD